MKFSIITPTYNSEKYLAETIESVLSQKGDFEVEYIIIDGGSNDNTVEIIKKYSEIYPIKWISEKDKGMYSAINKGFSMTTGDIFAWINSDDIYEPKALDTISKVFKKFPEIQWAKGITSTINKNSEKTRIGKCRIYRQDWLVNGIYGMESYFVEQDSVFWKKELWNKVGGVNEKLKLAGDYYLWIQFAKHSPLWSINYPISCFRKRDNQLSKDIKSYKKEQKEIRPQRNFNAWKIRAFFTPQSRILYYFPKLEIFFLWLYRMIFKTKNEYIFIKNNEPQKGKMKSYQIS